MINVSNEIIEKNKPHFTLNNFFPKVVPFMRKCGKNIVQPDRPQITIKNGACSLHAG
jgi:hypothetical protein